MLKKLLAVATLTLITCPLFGQLIVTPSDDGAIYGLGGGVFSVSNSGYLLASGYIRGALEFPTVNLRSYGNVQLSINPYGMPLHDPTVEIFGYDLADGILTGDDYLRGSLLGTMVLPASLTFGQQAYFDVSSFVRGSTGDYIGFLLVTESTDVFSSKEYNLGTPPRLVATGAVPEPGTFAIVGALLLVGLSARKFRRS